MLVIFLNLVMLESVLVSKVERERDLLQLSLENAEERIEHLQANYVSLSLLILYIINIILIL